MIDKKEWVIVYQLEQSKENRNPAFVFHTGAFVEQIQIDAWRQGMLDAKQIALNLNDGHEWPVTRAIDENLARFHSFEEALPLLQNQKTQTTNQTK